MDSSESLLVLFRLYVSLQVFISPYASIWFFVCLYWPCVSIWVLIGFDAFLYVVMCSFGPCMSHYDP